MLSLVRSLPPKHGGRHCYLSQPRRRFATNNIGNLHHCRNARMSTLHSLTAGVRGYATDTEIEKGKEEEKEKEGNGEGEDKGMV